MEAFPSKSVSSVSKSCSHSLSKAPILPIDLIIRMKVKRTRSQERILTLLKSLQQAVSAQDIYVEMRQRDQAVGLATIYRSLEALKLEGVVQVRTLSNGESVYSCIKEDRHHLTCLHCGESIAIDECPVHDLETELETLHHFKVFYHTLEFFGMCDRCQLGSNPIKDN
jgi:Fur family ferric uptake transcriptional regulator